MMDILFCIRSRAENQSQVEQGDVFVRYHGGERM